MRSTGALAKSLSYDHRKAEQQSFFVFHHHLIVPPSTFKMNPIQLFHLFAAIFVLWICVLDSSEAHKIFSRTFKKKFLRKLKKKQIVPVPIPVPLSA
jgi:hypothetical protein